MNDEIGGGMLSAYRGDADAGGGADHDQQAGDSPTPAAAGAGLARDPRAARSDALQRARTARDTRRKMGLKGTQRRTDGRMKRRP
jgi:hypothetical protein